MSDSGPSAIQKAGKRPCRLNVRFTLDEYAHLRDQARLANVGPARLVRALVAQLQLKAIPRYPDDVYRSIKSFATNLNQLARQANIGRVDTAEMEALRGQADRLLEALYR